MLISLFALLMGAFLMVGCSDEKVSNSEGKEEKATPAEQKKYLMSQKQSQKKMKMEM